MHKNKILIISPDTNLYQFLTDKLDSASYSIIINQLNIFEIESLLDSEKVSLIIFESEGNDLDMLANLQETIKIESIPVWVCPLLSVDNNFFEKLAKLGISDCFVKFGTLDTLKRKIEKFFIVKRQLSDLKTAKRDIRSSQTLTPIAMVRPDIDIGIMCEPKEDIGGDFYDLFPTTDGSFIITLGDVTGHGFSAAVYQPLARKVIQMALKNSGSILEGIQTANRELASTLPAGKFVALLVAEWYPELNSIRFYRMGIPHPIFRFKNGDTGLLMAQGGVLGLQEQQFATFKVEPVFTPLEEDEILLFYTDGGPESVLQSGEALGFDGVRNILSTINASLSAQEIATKVLKEIKSIGKVLDDMSLVVVKRKADPRNEWGDI